MEREKRPFDIHIAVGSIREVTAGFPKAALFQLADEGFRTPFELLIACIISIRTFDEITVPCAHTLFELGRTPAELSRLSPEAIDAAIVTCTFHEAKAGQIHTIARIALAEYGGDLPCEVSILRSFRGVGPKCANLVAGISCNQPHIGVDIHVHRVTNRWGYVQETTPERTMSALEGILPKEYWVEINRLLVPFGKHICTGRLPHCLICPVLDMCRQAGVKGHR